MTRSLGALVLSGMLAGCGVSIPSKDIVLADALRKTDCAALEVEQDGGRYIASGCGKKLVYVCSRPAGFGASKPQAIANAECRQEPAVDSSPK
jgi:hypothetical protein